MRGTGEDEDEENARATDWGGTTFKLLMFTRWRLCARTVHPGFTGRLTALSWVTPSRGSSTGLPLTFTFRKRRPVALRTVNPSRDWMSTFSRVISRMGLSGRATRVA